MEPALMSSHRHDWCTPKHLIESIEAVGQIVLDPCWSEDAAFEPPNRLTESDDGLAANWAQHLGAALSGLWIREDQPRLVFVNPPYGRAIPKWVDKMADTWDELEGLRMPDPHSSAWDAQMIALLPARTDTRWFNRLCGSASEICFLRGRLTFEGAPAPAPFPSMLVYWGRLAAFGRVFGQQGQIMRLRDR